MRVSDTRPEETSQNKGGVPSKEAIQKNGRKISISNLGKELKKVVSKVSDLASKVRSQVKTSTQPPAPLVAANKPNPPKQNRQELAN